MASLYISTQTYAEFQEQVSETWDLDPEYTLRDVEYIGGRWTGVFTDNNVDQVNAYNETADFATLRLEIQERWDEGKGYNLIDIDYIDDKWIAVFDNSSPLTTGYDISADLDEFAVDVRDRWDEGYGGLTNVEYANGYWFSIFDRGIENSSYRITDSLTGLEEVIQTQEEEGFDLVGVEYAEETWVGVFNDSLASTSAYSITSDRGEFNQDLAEFTEAGYDLIDFERVDKQWIGVYEKTNSDLAELERTDALGREANQIIIDYTPAINIPTPGSYF
ncbi:MAG: hypothetical protein AAFY63_04435 [Cyanobacteria bacterium J06643_13]